MLKKPAGSIIIPTYNERENLQSLLPVLFTRYPDMNIFVVDDNSFDGTQKIVSDFSFTHPQLHLIEREKKLGRGSAVLAGMEEALKKTNCNYYIEMDADFSHDPSEVKSLIEAAAQKRIIIGSRYVENAKIVNWPRTRFILSRLANWYIKILLGLPIEDSTNGFRLYPKEAVNILLKNVLYENGYANLSEIAFILYKKGFEFKEIPITFVNRKKGVTKTNWKEYIKSLFAIPRIRLRYQ